MKKSKAPLILSIITVVFAVLAAVSSVLTRVMMTPVSDSNGDAVTTEAALKLSGFFLFMACNLGASAVTLILGVASTSVAILKKRAGIIWIPLLAVAIAIASSGFMFAILA